MRKLTVVLLLLVGIFTSCENNVIDDCGCVETIFDNQFVNTDGFKNSELISEEYVVCQEEYTTQTYERTIFVKCNTVKIY
jgi:hypothetical protein|tara:strand:- start:278 stop:517 length:240 start_codon:yes stop_codon:yes gene_type:complete